MDYEALRYFWKFLKQVGRECVSFSKDQIMPLVMGLIGALLALRLKLVPLDQRRAAYEAALLPFGFGFGVYLIAQAVRAPFVLHREQEEKIHKLAADLEKQRTPEGNLLARFVDPEWVARQRHTRAMEHLAREMSEQRIRSQGGYSEGALATLARLLRDGNELLKVSISPNSPNPILERDNWLKKHEKWRDRVLSLLRGRDIAIFEALVTAGDQTKGHAGAIDRIHGDKRGQLFAELDRLTGLLGRYEV